MIGKCRTCKVDSRFFEALENGQNPYDPQLNIRVECPKVRAIMDFVFRAMYTHPAAAMYLAIKIQRPETTEKQVAEIIKVARDFPQSDPRASVSSYRLKLYRWKRKAAEDLGDLGKIFRELQKTSRGGVWKDE